MLVDLQLIGMVLLGGGIYLVVVGDRYSYLTGTIYTSGAVIIMLCGLGTVVVSILGICGSCCKKWIVLLIVSFWKLLDMRFMFSIQYTVHNCAGSYHSYASSG